MKDWNIYRRAIEIGVEPPIKHKDTINKIPINEAAFDLLKNGKIIEFNEKRKSFSFTILYLIGVDLQGANLNGANLEDANLNGANLEDANLNGANLEDANLIGTKFMKANLRFANLRFANLRLAKLENADLSGANLNGANLEDANLNGVIKANLEDEIN